MGLVAEFDLPCEGLPLVGVAAAVPAATVTLELQFNHGDRPPFLVTVTGGSPTATERALADADDVAEYTLVGRAGETRRYQAMPAFSLEEQLGGYLDDLRGLEALATADAIIERIEVTGDGWTQTGWFADRETFDEFRTFWQRNGYFRLRRLTRDGEPEPPGDGLTDRQREALRTAYELGYFDIPRDASLEDVAAELGISASSVSERLRRAQTQLIEETVAPMWPPLLE
ncbi:HTH DNA binding domain [Halobiforma haloterrestris]|uniref:HTH DNA binding domain n=1 Tax=Natronobacterium haloterrestre TaxID=148448 RepID=A0A1I1HMJ1_NATHA|nr:helix-turn-helix domain-containing protein [Halobiforma haloterrestris]SFC24782.1 HTH DNA binding domain [Halobiforma haloterrestris]